MSKVFCVTEPITYRDGAPVTLFDISPALKYGEIEILAKHNHNMFATVPMVRFFREKLKDFNDDDYILPVGDPVIIATVAAIAADMNNGQYKILKWDKPTRQYASIQVNIDGKEYVSDSQ
jgi:hypothetical protein